MIQKRNVRRVCKRRVKHQRWLKGIFKGNVQSLFSRADIWGSQTGPPSLSLRPLLLKTQIFHPLHSHRPNIDGVRRRNIKTIQWDQWKPLWILALGFRSLKATPPMYCEEELPCDKHWLEPLFSCCVFMSCCLNTVGTFFFLHWLHLFLCCCASILSVYPVCGIILIMINSWFIDKWWFLFSKNWKMCKEHIFQPFHNVEGPMWAIIHNSLWLQITFRVVFFERE